MGQIDEVLLTEVREQLETYNDKETAHEIVMDLKGEGFFDLPLGLQEFPDDELGTMPLW